MVTRAWKLSSIRAFAAGRATASLAAIHRRIDAANGPLTPSLSPSEGERVPAGRVRGLFERPERPDRHRVILSVLPLLLLSLALAGCTVKLIADYDQKMDDGVTQLQKKTEAFLLRLERAAGSPEGNYTNYIATYDDIKVDLSSLQVRADALALNRLTAEQLSLLRDSLSAIEERHRTNGLRPIIVQESRKALDRQFAAILTLEVAKKRDLGETRETR